MADDKTPPQITTGSFVSWGNGKGRVDLVVTTGKVPGVESDVEATSDSPAARVVVWRDGKPTREKIAASTHTLRRIPPLDKDEKKADPMAALVTLTQEHATHAEEMGLPEHAALSGEAIKTAFDRGLLSWPGDDVTSLTPSEWGLGRAEMLSKAALGEVETTHDADLLASGHVLHKDAAVAVAEPPVATDAPAEPSEPMEPAVEPEEAPPGTEPVEPPPGTEPVAPPTEGEPTETEDEPSIEAIEGEENLPVVDAADLADVLAAIEADTSLDEED